MIRFKSISSGSCGNCYFLGVFNDEGKCDAGILIDAGVSIKRLRNELKEDGLSLDDIKAVLVTHDHLDHIRSLGSYCKHLKIPVWTTPELHKALAHHSMTYEWIGYCRSRLEQGWNEIVPGLIKARYFIVPHDASQTVGYAILFGSHRYVHITDCGRMTDEALNWCRQADSVVLESNYDSWMLEHGPYPRELQDRIRNGHGHLSNDECAEAIRQFRHDGLENLFLCHLSEHNNTPQAAMDASRRAFDGDSGRTRLLTLPRQTATPLWTLDNKS